jgi:fatty-acyl-CoA synthase
MCNKTQKPTMTCGSYHHQGNPQPLLGETIGEFLWRRAMSAPDAEALVCRSTGMRLTNARLFAHADRVARALLALGYGRGDRIAILAPNNVQWTVIQLAAARIGVVLVNLNPASLGAELAHALKLSRAQAIFFVPSFHVTDFEAMLLDLCPEARSRDANALHCAALPHLRHLIVYDPDDDELSTTHPGIMPWAALLRRADDLDPTELDRAAAALDSDDPINIQFTSGTTGRPKAVVLTHHNILNNAWFAGEALRLRSTDRVCVPVPFFHCFGMVIATLATLAHGATMVLPGPWFDAEATLDAVQAEGCTVLHGVPTMFIHELELLRSTTYELGTLRTGIIGGAPCPEDLVKRVVSDMHCPDILIGYGQTEASPLTHVTRPDDPPSLRFATVGTSLPHQEAKIIDLEEGRIVPLGEPGEICFRGYHIMRGYDQDPAATAQCIDGAGWLHSGDLGTMESGGYVHITGRLKDMIIRGGENIYPAEIEAFYSEHPQIEFIAVFGIPDEVLGERVGAWIKLHEGQTADPDDLRNWARGRLAHHKIPNQVWLVDEFPQTASGKIQRHRIRDIVIRDLNRQSGMAPVASPGATPR